MSVNSSSSAQTADAAPPVRRPLSRRRRAVFICVWAAYIGGLLWLGAWGYRAFRLGGFSNATPRAEILQMYYPELVRSGVAEAELHPDDEHFDVLLLGGSVLEDAAPAIEARLRAQFGDRTRVFNLAKAAHTSRDSALKFSTLREKPFDLIIDYDGVNDVRMNSCPSEHYRDDYTHCRWYRSIERRLEAEEVKLTDLLHDEVDFVIPLGEPEPELLQYGDTIKTDRAFRNNLEEIVTAARENGVPVVLMTFAYHIPTDYSREKFEANQLDYGEGHYKLPAELWGKPQNVAHTLDAQNKVIAELAAEYDNVIVVDQAQMLPADGVHFSDPCHLTNAGDLRLASNISRVLRERWPQPSAAP